jgi:hypothetical protein
VGQAEKASEDKEIAVLEPTAKGRPRYNWEAIRDEYVAGDDSVTLDSLAAKYGCNPTTIRNHSRKGEWGSQRRLYRDRVTIKVRERASIDEAEARAKLSKVGQGMLLLGGQTIQRCLSETKGQTIQVVCPDCGLQFKHKHQVSALSADDARKMIATATDTISKAHGIPEVVETDRGFSDDERLERIAELFDRARARRASVSVEGD